MCVRFCGFFLLDNDSNEPRTVARMQTCNSHKVAVFLVCLSHQVVFSFFFVVLGHILCSAFISAFVSAFVALLLRFSAFLFAFVRLSVLPSCVLCIF